MTQCIRCVEYFERLGRSTSIIQPGNEKHLLKSEFDQLRDLVIRQLMRDSQVKIYPVIARKARRENRAESTRAPSRHAVAPVHLLASEHSPALA
jgi:hypothetical protein